ncbi:MAG: nucleotidyltransferase domain-containing protein [bacterium]
MKNYTTLIENIKRRTNPDIISESILLDKTYSDELRQLANKKVLEYVKRAMRGVEPKYTQRSIEAGNKVKSHLKDNNSTLDYKFQGSVMSNTHIVGHSDIDLVQISNSFYSHENQVKFTQAYNSLTLSESQINRLLEVINGTPYAAKATDTLRKIRNDAERVLTSVYTYVNTRKAKSIEVELTNPKRSVDVVTASWYKNVNSVLTNDEDRRGIQIYDKERDIRLPVDFPFLKIKLLNEKDAGVNGRLKKMIRFLKNIKADSGVDINLTSFDISSICYNIPSYKYSDKVYFQLVFVLYEEFARIADDKEYRDSIMSIDGSEPIFKNQEEKVRQVKLLFKELNDVFQDLIPYRTRSLI